MKDFENISQSEKEKMLRCLKSQRNDFFCVC